MTTLEDLFDIDLFHKMIGEGYVRIQAHPDLMLAIANYTEKAAYDNVWNPVTRTCRGLIFHPVTGEIVARPFAKFMNYGQFGADPIELDAPVHVSDKMDGSLGILYPTPDGYAIATRGSFTSDQALHATAVWRDRYADHEPPPGMTMLFEIVYPENRIVVDYGNDDDLILLGAVDIATGEIVDAAWISLWPGRATVEFAAATFADALALPPRRNAEGVVVRCLRTGGMVKLKQEDYVALHRIVTGLSARTVWQHLVDGRPLDELIAPLPDEFHGWVKTTAEEILAAVDRRYAAAHRAFNDTVAALPNGWTRRDFALSIVDHPLRWALFDLLDRKDIRPKLLIVAKPEAFVTPSGRIFTEETA